jgi:uncharacterized membrane protein YqhA
MSSEPSRMDNKPIRQRMGIGGWIAVAVMAGLLVAAVLYAADVWRALSDVAMSETGWAFLILGAVLTIAVGGGLMALVFYSARHDYDR